MKSKKSDSKQYEDQNNNQSNLTDLLQPKITRVRSYQK